MNNTLRITLIVVAALFGVAILIAGGIFIGQNISGRYSFGFDQFPNNFMYRGNNYDQPFGMGPGMMGRGFFRQNDGHGQPNRSYEMGPGMMGGGFFGRTYKGDPLSIGQAKNAFDAYLADFGSEDLFVHEVMVFDQNAYAVIKEESTGMAAMELLVDHDSQLVYPEHGPNRMWNLKYGMMAGGCGSAFGAGCGMNFTSNTEEFKFEGMPVTLEDAQTAAKSYLDAAVPGANVAGGGFTFYGYYTFDYEVDGKMAGMLSVNGFSGDVWSHTWHGQFIEEAEFD